MAKTRVGIVFGGRSAEHEVSLQSAKSIIGAIDKTKYDIVLIGIDKEGRWYLNDASHYLLHEESPKLIQLQPSPDELALVPGERSGQLINRAGDASIGTIDVVFPVLHGTYGEDGTIQGLLKLANIPFVGASVLGSAIGMDKDVAKRLLRDAGIPVAAFTTLASPEEADPDRIINELGIPLFVKPANLGSSVGITRVSSREDLLPAIRLAFQYDRKVLVEEAVVGREIECSVLGNDDPVASLPGEVIPHAEFYSYEAKYVDENGAALEIPARLEEAERSLIQRLAVKAFKVLCCEGMARVDFFLKANGAALINEINTIPGFTRISMYPKLWEVSGLPYPALIDRLIELAIERHRRERALRTTFDLKG